MQCHKCQYNGKADKHCLSCKAHSDLELKHQAYIKDENLVADVPHYKLEQATHLSEEDEDALRIFFSELFSLSPLELLYIQSEMQRKTITEYARSMEKLRDKIGAGEFSLPRVHAIRKRLAETKMKKFSIIFQTAGRRSNV